MPKVTAPTKTAARTASKGVAAPYSLAPISLTMLELHTLRASGFEDPERRFALKDLQQKTFFEIVKYDRSSVTAQLWKKKNDNSLLPYRVTLRDYFSEENLKPMFSTIMPKRFCDCVERSYGLVYFGMHKTVSGYEAHRVKFYRITNPILPDNPAAVIRDALAMNNVDTCDGFCIFSDDDDDGDKSSYGYCRMCGDNLYGGQHVDCQDDGAENHCTRCGKAIA